jgi:hypothetical protein
VQFWQTIAQASDLSFPVVFYTENYAVHLGNPTFSSVYLPKPRWHHLKAYLFLAIHSADEHRMIYSFWNIISYSLHFLFFFSDNIMANVASKQQTTALFLPTIVTCTRRHTELTKKTDKPDGKPVLCQRTFGLVFRVVFFFFTQLNCTVWLIVYGALYLHLNSFKQF